MTLDEFRKQTKYLPGSMEIILQKDLEGNNYSPADGADPDCIYICETAGNGIVYSTNLSADYNCMEYEDWVVGQFEFNKYSDFAISVLSLYYGENTKKTERFKSTG